jgi:hypothetical protein
MMSIVQGKVLPWGTRVLSWLGLSSVIVVLAMASQAGAADPQVWQGQYNSNALKKIVFVRLTLDASPPELRFEPIGCRVGLKPIAQNGQSEYSMIRYREDEMSGPYCGTWVGGSLKTQQAGNARAALKMTLVSASGKSLIEVTLSQLSRVP